MLFTGTRPDQSFYLELFGIYDPGQARASGRSVYLDHIARGGGLTRLMLNVTSMGLAADRLRRHGIDVSVEEFWAGDRKMATW